MKERQFYIISDLSKNEEVFKAKYICIINAIRKTGVVNFVNASGHDYNGCSEEQKNGIDFHFKYEDGAKVMQEVRKSYPSSQDFFSDGYEEEEFVEMFGQQEADMLYL